MSMLAPASRSRCALAHSPAICPPRLHHVTTAVTCRASCKCSESPFDALPAPRASAPSSSRRNATFCLPALLVSSVADAWRPGAKRGGRCMAARSQAQTSAESRTRRSRQQQQQKNAGAGCMQVDVDVPVSICNDVALVCEDREPAVRMVLRKLFLRRLPPLPSPVYPPRLSSPRCAAGVLGLQACAGHGRIAVPAGEPWDKDDSGFETGKRWGLGEEERGD
ncbi:unnamed protein product [Closterium sp. NIES-65]|nr:unnamed protein product [Closterium sp. NIES-65]